MVIKVPSDRTLPDPSQVPRRRFYGSPSNTLSTPVRAATDSEDEDEDDEDDNVDYTHTAYLTRSSRNTRWDFEAYPHSFPVCIASVSPSLSTSLQRGDTIITINGVSPESHADAMLMVQRAGLHLQLCVRRVPVCRPPTPPRPASSCRECRSPIPAAELDQLLRAPGPPSGPAADVEALWRGIFAARHARLTAAAQSGAAAVAQSLRRAPRQAVYDRSGCPFGPRDGITDAFHDVVQREMTRMALARPAEWADDDAGDAVAWATWALQHDAPGAAPESPGDSHAVAIRDAEIAAHAAARCGPGREALAEAHGAMMRAAVAAAAEMGKERYAEAERLARAEAAAAGLRGAYEAATAHAGHTSHGGHTGHTGHGGHGGHGGHSSHGGHTGLGGRGGHGGHRRRPRQSDGGAGAAGSRLCGLPLPMADADGAPRNMRRVEMGDETAASRYLRLPTPPLGPK